MDVDRLKKTCYSTAEHHGQRKHPHGLVEVELSGFGFLLDPFQSLTWLKNPSLSFVYTSESTSQYIHTHTHSLTYICIYIYAHIVCVCVCLCVYICICLRMWTLIPFISYSLLVQSCCFFINTTDSNKAHIFFFNLAFYLLSPVSVSTFQTETKAGCLADLLKWRQAIKQTIG